MDILFYEEIRIYTYKALKNCELLALNKKYFHHLLNDYKEIGDNFVQNADFRKRETKKIIKDANNFCEEHFQKYNPDFNQRRTQNSLRRNTLINLTGFVYFFIDFSHFQNKILENFRIFKFK